MWKENFEESKQRYLQWWNQKGTVLSMWEHIPKMGEPYEWVAKPMVVNDAQHYWLNARERAGRLHYEMSRNSYKADILPVANTQLGPGSLAAILGASLQGRDNTIWIHPDPSFNGSIVMDENNPWWLLHLELLSACRALSEGKYMVGCPDLVEGLDVLASLKGSDKALIDLMLEPDKTMEQLQQINRIYFDVFDRIYEIINVNGEMAWCYFSLWAPDKLAKLQVDISLMISTDDFRTFCIPFLKEQCVKIPYTLYHLDGVDAIRHLEAILEIDELKAVQWTPGEGRAQGGSSAWYHLYKRILEAKKSVMIHWIQLNELEPLFDAIGSDGLHLNVDFKSEKEIEQAMNIVEKYIQK